MSLLREKPDNFFIQDWVKHDYCSGIHLKKVFFWTNLFPVSKQIYLQYHLTQLLVAQSESKWGSSRINIWRLKCSNTGLNLIRESVQHEWSIDELCMHTQASLGPVSNSSLRKRDWYGGYGGHGIERMKMKRKNLLKNIKMARSLVFAFLIP